MMMKTMKCIFYVLIFFQLGAVLVYGVCYRPNFTDPYAIILDPDQAIYEKQYEMIEFSCFPGHTPSGFPPGGLTYCYPPPKRGWTHDPSEALCLAQCNMTVFDNDINATSSDGSQQTIFDHGEVAEFACLSLGQYRGTPSATCNNGTFDYSGDEPSCQDFVVQLKPSTASSLGSNGLQDITLAVTSNVPKNKYSPITLFFALTVCIFTMTKTNVLMMTLAFILYLGITSPGAYADCFRPSFADPYAIVLSPDQATYSQYYAALLSCLPGHTSQGFSDNGYTYCDTPNLGWNPDPFEARCLAQCNITVFDNDINATSSDGFLQATFDHGEVAEFSCASLGQYTGPSSATCNNGTFDYTDEPSCLAYCPISDGDLGAGLYYTTPEDPVYNDTNTNPLYFEDGDVLNFRCGDGYDSLDCTTQTKCQRTCQDGSWDPPVFPYCNETNECDSNPCQNNATCNDLLGEYNCTCITGYEGTNCERTMTTAMMTTELSSSDTMSTSTYFTTGIAATASTPDGTSMTGNTTSPSTPADAVSTIESSTNTPSMTPESTTITPDASTIETSTNASLNTPESTTITPDASTIEPSTNASSKAPESTTTTPDASTIEPSANASSKAPESTTTTPDASTIETSTNVPSTRLSTAKPTTPEKTERPKTTPEPCECGARETCNTNNTCDCNAGYYRNEVTTECEESTSIDVSIRIEEIGGKEAKYIAELEDPTSDEFKELEENVCEPFNDIYVNETSYQECLVLNFAEGSIIVNYLLLFDETSDVNATTVTKTIYNELGSENGAFKNFTVDNTSIIAKPLDYCKEEVDDCSENAACASFPEGSFNCTCNEGYVDTSSDGTPGRNCTIVTTAKPTVEPIEPMEVWKVVVGVTVPIIGILTLSVVAMFCWQSRHQSPKVVSSSPTTSKKKQTYRDDDESQDDGRPSSMMIMNNNGKVQEVVLPWHNNPAEGEFIFASENGNGRTSMLPMVDYPIDNNYGSTLSPTNDPLDNIVSSYDNYNYHHHDTANTTEVDGKYF